MPISRRVVFTAVLCLGIVSSFLFLYDNTDRSSRSLRTNDAELFMIAASNPDLYAALNEEHERTEAEFEEFIETQDNAFSCLRDPKAKRTAKEQLENFVEGDCAPVIVVPGLMATKLVAEIDCDTLKEYHPEIMSACGWNTCSSWNILGNKPDSEYVMWIPKLTSPMSILSVQDHQCFGRLIGLRYNNKKNTIYEKYSDVEGVRITWYGNTPGTYKDADGGFSAVTNLLPLPVQTADTKGFLGLAKYLTSLGYQKGLSLFAVPYDFRRTHLANGVAYSLARTIRLAYELTGKKVVIVSHSLGNINTLPVLTKMDQAEKDKMIAAYVAVTAPLGGASKPLRLLFGGDKNLMLKNLVGFKFFNQKSFLGGASSGYDLLPRDTFYRFRNQPWMKELLERIRLENTVSPYDVKGYQFWKKNDVPYSFFPNPTEMCFEDFTQRPEQCKTLITDLGVQPVARINGKAYYANQTSMKELFYKHFTMNDPSRAMEMYEDSLANGIDRFENPKVPVVYIYASHLKTELYHEWNYNPADLTREGKFAFPSTTTDKYGDATVEVSYSLPIAMKWAWEHNNKVAGAKPIKIVEYCSSFNQKDTVWDKTNASGANVMTTTEYMGAACSCWTKLPGAGDSCDHAGILADTYFIEKIGEVVITKEKGQLRNTLAYKKTLLDLLDVVKDLPHLRKPRLVQDVKTLLA